MTINVDITRRDVRDCARHITNRHPNRFAVISFLITIGACSGLFAVNNAVRNFGLDFNSFYWGAAFGVCYSLVCLGLGMLNRQRLIALQPLGAQRITVKEDGIRITSECCDVLSYWTGDNLMERGKRCFFFRTAPGAAIIAPYRSFASVAEREQFAAEIRNYWNQWHPARPVE